MTEYKQVKKMTEEMESWELYYGLGVIDGELRINKEFLKFIENKIINDYEEGVHKRFYGKMVEYKKYRALFVKALKKKGLAYQLSPEDLKGG